MRPNVQKTTAVSTSSGHQQLQPLDKALKKFEKHIELGQYEGPDKLQNRAISTLIQTNKKLEAQRIRVKDKSDRATIEQVLDPRTRMILFKLLSRSAIMCTCMCVHVCVCMYAFTCMCVHVCVYMYVCACMRVHVCVNMYACTCMREHVCVYMYACTCMCVHVCVYMYICVYIYAFTCIVCTCIVCTCSMCAFIMSECMYVYVVYRTLYTIPHVRMCVHVLYRMLHTITYFICACIYVCIILYMNHVLCVHTYTLYSLLVVLRPPC